MIEFYDYPENTDAEILAKAQFFKKFTLGLSERMQALGENAGPAEEEIYENNLRLIIAFLNRVTEKGHGRLVEGLWGNEILDMIEAAGGQLTSRVPKEKPYLYNGKPSLSPVKQIRASVIAVPLQAWIEEKASDNIISAVFESTTGTVIAEYDGPADYTDPRLIGVIQRNQLSQARALHETAKKAGTLHSLRKIWTPEVATLAETGDIEQARQTYKNRTQPTGKVKVVNFAKRGR